MNTQLIENIEVKSLEVSNLLKIMSHPKRLLILCLLSGKELSVSEIENLLDISQSQLSQYLKILTNQELIKSKRAGKFVYYSIKDARISLLHNFLEENFCKEVQNGNK